MTPLTPLQTAYLAGFIDADGSLESQMEKSPQGRTPRFVLRLSFTLATPEPLATIARWLDLQVRVYPSTDPRRSARHRLHVPKTKAVAVLQAVLPHLILKRRQAEIMLEIEAVRAAASPSRSLPMGKQRRMPASAVEKMTALHRELRSLKSNKRPGRPGW